VGQESRLQPADSDTAALLRDGYARTHMLDSAHFECPKYQDVHHLHRR